MKKKMYKMKRNKFRGEIEFYHENGFLLGRQEIPSYNGQETRTYYIDNATMEIIEAGKFTNPFQAGEKLVQIWESKAGERQARKEKEYQEWLNKPLIQIMLNDYNSMEDNRFKPSDFMRFYRQKVYDYEEKYPELAIEKK